MKYNWHVLYIHNFPSIELYIEYNLYWIYTVLYIEYILYKIFSYVWI